MLPKLVYSPLAHDIVHTPGPGGVVVQPPLDAVGPGVGQSCLTIPVLDVSVRVWMLEQQLHHSAVASPAGNHQWGGVTGSIPTKNGSSRRSLISSVATVSLHQH